MDTEKIIKALGIKSGSVSQIQRKIREWNEWYQGNVENFHDYTVFTGRRSVNRNRASLNMGKTVSETYADLLLNEKVEFTITGENEENIMQTLEDNKFWTKGNQLIELVFALGTGAFVLGLDDITVSESGTVDFKDSKVVIRYMKASDIFPIEYTGEEVTKIAFRTFKNLPIGGKVKEFSLFTIFSQVEEGGTPFWVIENKLYDERGTQVELQEYLPLVAEGFRLDTEYPPFALIRPNVVNTIDTTSPYGMSIFADSVDVLKEIDTVFDSLTNEFNLGKKRIFIDEKALTFDEETGQPRFDDNDLVFYTLGGLIGDEESKVRESIQESDFTLRIEEHVKGLKLGLDTLSRKTGLGGDYFSYDNKGAVTATEVVSRNSALFRSISKHSILLREELEALIFSINAMLNLANGTSYDVDVVIDFDDSIIEDQGAIEERALVELNSGVIDLHEYLKITRGFTDEMAKEFIDSMEARKRGEDTEEEFGDGTEI